MSFFQRRRAAADDFLEAIRPELLALSTPEPSDSLRERIVASRKAGVRTLLPDVNDDRRPVARIVVPIAVAVALMILLLPMTVHRSGPHLTADDVSSELLGPLAYAQARRADRPALPPMRIAAAGRLHPMSLEFTRRRTDSGVVRESLVAFQITADSASNVPAWRITSRDLQPGTSRIPAAAETTYIARSDLALLRRAIHVTPYHSYRRINVWQQFTSDSITGRMNTEGPSIGAGRVFARQLPPTFAPYLTEATTSAFLMGVRLTPEWRGSASLLGWAVRDDDFFVPLEMRVLGKETITVPAGRFECWRLAINFAGKQLLYWARVSDGLGVRILDSHDAPNRMRELVLTRER